jgi:hypothetical protein
VRSLRIAPVTFGGEGPKVKLQEGLKVRMGQGA